MRKISLIGLSISLIALCACTTKTTQSFEVSDLVKSANDYISENKDSVIDAFKNKYHLTAPIGWINDPNGFSEFNDKYHLFYQYNPYEAVWGPMHWGHQTTKDFVKWEYEDVALAPDTDYDSFGCFSGTALVEDGVQYLYYTAVTDKQNQSVAYSYDGKTYKKIDDLLLSGDDLPSGFSNNDFRDPKIFKRNGKYYLIIGNKDDSTNTKQLVMFEADNPLGPFVYSGVIYSRKDLGGILECPDLVTIDGTDVLIFSPQSIGADEEYRFQNTDSCVYVLGNLSVNTKKFYSNIGVDMEEFDKGFSFYAPQTLTTSDGRTIMIAWMRSWSEPNLTKEDLWCGAMTLPRELSIKDNHIYQSPVREIYNYLNNKVDYNKTGTYKITYSIKIKYIKQTKSITRTINIIDEDSPTITLINNDITILPKMPNES